MLLNLLVLTIFITVSSCCKCAKLSPKDAYCSADWVSHVKVTASKLVPDEVAQKRMYTVEHLKVMKIPPGLSALSEEIVTPEHSATCGLHLDVGKEYLLAGRCSENVLRVSSCGQIISDESEEQSFGIVMEWKNVSADFQNQVENFKC